MLKRAKSSGVHLQQHDAALVKGMLNRGDRQHDIAAWFGVNSGRIAEVATGASFGWVPEANPDDLPPPGPYPKAAQAMAAIAALKQARTALETAEATIRKLSK